jgi:hypothetical protein
MATLRTHIWGRINDFTQIWQQKDYFVWRPVEGN